MDSSDDLAEQQLFYEIQASAKKAQHQFHEPPPNSAVQSANLLNAARLNRRRTVAAAPSSSPSHASGLNNVVGGSGRTLKSDAGKLKPVTFLREDLARQPRESLARRGDPFELGLSSPEKSTVKPSAKARQKPQKKSRKLGQNELFQDLEEQVPSSYRPDTEETEHQTPPGSPPPHVTDVHYLDEVPQTPSRASELLAGKPKSHSDLAIRIEEQPRARKRKASDQSLATGRQSKSPRTAGVAENETAETIQAKGSSRPQRPRSTHPKVIVPVTKPSTRNTRAAQRKQIQVPYTEERDDHQEEFTDAGHQQAVESGSLVEGENEHGLDSPKLAPERPKRQKFKKLKASHNTNGLDIPSDEESRAVERSGRVKQARQQLDSAETEHPQRRKGRKPKASKDIDDLGTASEQEQRSQPQEPEPKRQKGRPPKTSKNPKSVRATSIRNNEVEEPPEPAGQTRSKTRKAGRVPRASAEAERSMNDTSQYHHLPSQDRDTRKKNDALIRLLELNAAAQELEENDRVDSSAQANPDVIDLGDSDEEDESQNEDDHDDDGDGASGVSDIDVVIRFLDSGERSGDCQTEDAMEIKKACQKALEVLDDSDTDIDEVSTIAKHLQSLLSKYGADSDEKEHRSLKVDAYGYIFRHIVSYLKSLYDWLPRKYDDFESSLDAMRIITPLLSAIVAFKDRIADWKVKLPTRYKGDRFIQDVDINVIVPLRRLSETYRAALRGLKDEAQKKRAQEDAARKRREQQLRNQQKQESEFLRVEKKNHWIDLHVCRLKVEPDRHRRQALSLKQDYFDKKMATWAEEAMEGNEERDANGIPFSRVDVFKKRTVPPAHASSLETGKEWRDEELGALIEGLTNHAGPYVFQYIFENYCRPGCPLRRFGVPEITAKAVDVKMRLLARFQEQDWKEVPEWIAKIPILP